ncbi:MarR family winged helix-turn-helix transcriptional regulator [Deinococcus navajonensis]|uniref:MarR family winged helix-turn-helix transcriptional regulator n=1 Tax=Deinococcus navajonensis TaxID=309884 RepID=A0ABV8XNZ0_9DEIO
MPLEPGQSPGFLLWHATLRWQREITAALEPFGLTHVQFVLLACTWWLNGHDEQPNQLRLSRQAGIDVKMTSPVLRTLEEKGLIERTTDPNDTRAKRLQVTARGATLAPQAIEVVERVDRAFFGPALAPQALLFLTQLAQGTDIQTAGGAGIEQP